ncbi:hypothetical protein [Tsukamurella paurometabola]|nr:hypothetical protein [Tsukamurella paurometabola]UEA81718.1 hypothetical protein LK411_15145 [Tsukamurella paurometabola]
MGADANVEGEVHMYPNAAPPVPRIYRALALIQATIAALTLVGLVIWWMATYPSMSEDYDDDFGLGVMMFLMLTPTLIQVALMFVPLIGLAVFVARGSLPARVSSCCIWGALMLLGLIAVPVHPAYVLVLFVSLCMLLALAFADRLGGGRRQPPPPGPVPAGFPPPAPCATGQFPAVPPYQTGQFPAVPPHDSGRFPGPSMDKGPGPAQ